MGMTATPVNWSPPLVVLVGMGMGPGDLGAEAREWIRSAEVLAGGGRHLESFPEHRGERIPFKGPLRAFLDRIHAASSRKRTVVLASGDPFFFGIGRQLTDRVGTENVFALPNVTSLQVFFSRLKKPWDDVRAWSLHGREASTPDDWFSRHCGSVVPAFFTDPEHSPAWIAREMLKAGYTEWRMAVGEDLGTSTESVRWLALSEAAEMDFSPLNMAALFPAEKEGAEESCAELDEKKTFRETGCKKDLPAVLQTPRPNSGLSPAEPLLGLPESAFRHEAGLITKMEIRVVALAHLQLLPGQVLWDVGAGSGSVAIEAARMVPSAAVYAVEKEFRRIEDIQENIRLHGCHGVRALFGPAPDRFRGLPDPHRVFIGGSGGNLIQILEAVAERLRPSGRVVQTMVSLDNLEIARSFWREKGFAAEVSQIQVSRGVPIGGGLRLEALNPVFIMVVCEKP